MTVAKAKHMAVELDGVGGSRQSWLEVAKTAGKEEDTAAEVAGGCGCRQCVAGVEAEVAGAGSERATSGRVGGDRRQRQQTDSGGGRSRVRETAELGGASIFYSCYFF